MSDYNLKCELCGTPVRVVGDVTKSYDSAYDTLKAELSACRVELDHFKKNATNQQYVNQLVAEVERVRQVCSEALEENQRFREMDNLKFTMDLQLECHTLGVKVHNLSLKLTRTESEIERLKQERSNFLEDVHYICVERDRNKKTLERAKGALEPFAAYYQRQVEVTPDDVDDLEHEKTACEALTEIDAILKGEPYLRLLKET